MWQQLKLILWKNLLIRKRHYLLTIIEATVPVLLFLFIAYARSKIEGFTRIDINQTTYFEPYPTKLMQLPIGEFSLWYAPQNQFTEDIINRVQVTSQIPGEAIRGFSDDTFMHMAMESLGNKTVFAIQFKGNDPKQLDYDLRIYEKFLLWDTEILYNPLAEPGTGSFKYIQRGFIAMQIAINMAFMELSLGLYENQNVNDVVINLEEFPYPPHRSDSALNNLFIELLPLMTIISFIFLCPAVLKRVVEEKASGIKELMKMVGMKSWMIWLSWYIHAFVANLPAIIAIVIFMKVPMFNVNYPPIEYCNGLILFVFLLLYCISAISFCFFIASSFTKPSLALIFGVLAWLLTYFIPKSLIANMENPTILLTTLLSIFPNMALHFGYKIIAEYEMRETGASWSNLFRSASNTENDVTLGYIFILFICETILYLCLTVYIDNVRPGEYGIAKPLNYPYHYLKKSFKQLLNLLRSNSQINDECESLNIEDERKCIEVRNLKKKYGTKCAVDGLTFDIYKNQITVLLGHNGAGKTTTMSIITGMISATSGSVRINGINIKDHMNDVRKYLGLCPQHNLVFPDLTVDEHLRFFAMLKGASYQEAKEQSHTMLETLNLSDKKHSLASQLSGGMKRKLCLGMSLMGNSSVLILDEPTAGIDPESRRKLWNLLLELRKTRTILISTHFMDEADALADYILIMANGYKQCFGTPLELKKKYGTGYLVTITFNPDTDNTDNKDRVKSIIKQQYPEFEFVKEDGDKFVYRLPFTCKEIYQGFFTDFEQKKTEYQIINMSLTITTLQDVFMRTRKELDSLTKPKKPEADTDELDVFKVAPKQKSISSNVCVIVTSLLYKRILFLKKNGFIYAPGIILFLITVLATLLLGKYTANVSDLNEPPLKLDLTTYGRTTVYYSGANDSQQINKIKQFYKNEILQQNSEPYEVNYAGEAIANRGIENIAFYKKHMIIGAKFDERQGDIITTAYYSTHAIHSAPISINLAMNSILKTLLNDSYTITARNYPLPIVSTYLQPGEQSEVQVTLLWLILIPIGMLFLMGNFIIFPYAEVSTNFLHLQFVCGVTSKLYWITNFIFDYLFCIIQLICILFIVYLFRFCEYIQTFGVNEILAVFAIFAAYSFGQIPVVYLFSRRKSISGGFSLLLMSGMLCGTIFTVVVAALESSPSDYYRNLGKTFKELLLILCPQFGLSFVGIKFARKYVQNYNWLHMAEDKKRHLCVNNFSPCCGGEDTQECRKYEDYFINKDLGIWQDLLLMLLACLIYMIIILFMDSIKCKMVLTKLQTFIRQHLIDTKSYKDTEMAQTEELLNSNLCVKNVKKTYGLFKTVQAVRNTSFAVRKGECYGLLGVNGAGKTTTFMMLTKHIICDEGEINLKDNDKSISIEKDEYFNSIGYCPQMDSLNCSLTGEQLLTIVAMLKGYNREEAYKRATILLERFDLTEYKDNKCSTYSGGNLRKLSTSLAFIGEVDVVLLDEPTTGVDPASRQNFWDILLKFKNKHKRSIVLCSHSMDECEVLCDRIGIMKNGKIESEGTLDHLRQLHQKGYNIMLKLQNNIDDNNGGDCVDGIKKNSDTDSQRKLLATTMKNNGEICIKIDSPTNMSNEESFQHRLVQLEDDLKENFEEFTIKDQHGNMMYCHVNNKQSNLQLSDIFRKMEQLREMHPIIDDYTVTNASLEDVFLTVAQ